MKSVAIGVFQKCVEIHIKKPLHGLTFLLCGEGCEVAPLVCPLLSQGLVSAWIAGLEFSSRGRSWDNSQSVLRITPASFSHGGRWRVLILTQLCPGREGVDGGTWR